MTERLTIHQCQSRAKSGGGHNKDTFDLVGLNGRRRCTWLDAYFGLFTMEGESGFITVKQVEGEGDLIWVENCQSEGGLN